MKGLYKVNMLKKFLITIFTIFVSTTLASAGSCPLLVKKIDNSLSQTKQLSKEQLSEIKKLRDSGHKAHKDGDHAESVKILKQALKLLKG